MTTPTPPLKTLWLKCCRESFWNAALFLNFLDHFLRDPVDLDD